MLRFVFLLPTLFFAISILLLACQGDPNVADTGARNQIRTDTIHSEEIPAGDTTIYRVTDGMVLWSGQPAVGSPRTGTIRVLGGALLVHQGRLLSGNVTIDMHSIAVTDLADGGERRDLEGHLKHADFFEVARYPTGEFIFKEVLPSSLPDFNWVVSGDLTLKGKTNPVNIPVKMTITGEELVAQSPSFPIQRTQWGINFHSGALGTTKDKLIQDVIVLSLKLKGKKAS